MIKPPRLSTVTPAANPGAVANFMDTMAIQLADSADTLQASSMSNVCGSSIATAVERMVSRASQIRVLAEGLRISGDLECFDEACELAGWHPTPQALQSLQASH